MSRPARRAARVSPAAQAIIRAYAGVWPRIHPGAWMGRFACVIGDEVTVGHRAAGSSR